MGRAGLGRRHAVRVVANMHQMQVFSPKVVLNAAQKNFDAEVKAAVSTVVAGEHVVLCVEHWQITSPVFLQTINSLVSSGLVPGLFTPQVAFC